MYICEYSKYDLKFINPSGTSRGVLTSKPTWFIKISKKDNPQNFGLGECSPIEGLSIDPLNLIEQKLDEVVENINEIDKINFEKFPCIKFGLEMAEKDLLNNGNRIIYNNNFTQGNKSIRINGLIWMGSTNFMINQIKEKLEKGFSCLKLKIGALNFNDELAILKKIRTQFKDNELEIRVDANGSFELNDVYKNLEKLSQLDIHSIEQPIAINQPDQLQKLCIKSPIAIALDEELIKPRSHNEKEELIKFINPHYIVLKPSLLGGFTKTKQWISIAEKLNIEWWITSALESNIGLNAIAQFCGEYDLKLPQGLGTGNLYKNNIDSPLKLIGEHLSYDKNEEWNLNKLFRNDHY
jgi:o-succinylbenzoate synthase